jgi:hypothetical protein
MGPTLRYPAELLSAFLDARRMSVSCCCEFYFVRVNCISATCCNAFHLQLCTVPLKYFCRFSGIRSVLVTAPVRASQATPARTAKIHCVFRCILFLGVVLVSVHFLEVVALYWIFTVVTALYDLCDLHSFSGFSTVLVQCPHFPAGLRC